MDSVAEYLKSLLESGSAFGLIISLFGAYVGGILSSLTPCIYPMIPITIGVVGNTTKHQRPRDVLIRGLAYVLGMSIIYSFLGVLAGVSGIVFGSMTNTSNWYLGLGIVMTIASLMMLDVLPFDPQAWLDRSKRALGFKVKSQTSSIATERETSILGAFALGASSGFIAAPCTTPVLTAILGFIAQTQSVFYGLVLMLFFSFGLGTILILIAAFAGSLQKLPKAGAWMNKIKIFSGILILIFAEYLIYKAGK